MKTEETPDGTNEVAKFITWIIDSKMLQQKEIASICGFKNPNVITMIKQGKTRVPIDKITKLAKALRIDSADFFTFVMKAYKPAEYKVIVEVFGEPISTLERYVIDVLRSTIPKSSFEANPDYYINIIINSLIKN